MVAVAVDTLRISKRLTDAGMDARAAEGVSLALADVWQEREEGLATKVDIRVLKTEIDGLKHELRAEMRQQTSEILKWVIGSQIALVGMLFAAIKLL